MKNLNIRLLIKRMKNDELNISLPILIIGYLTLVFTCELLNILTAQPYTIYNKDITEYVLLVFRELIKIMYYSTITYIFTPKSFSFINSINVFIVANTIRLLVAFIFMPVCLLYDYYSLHLLLIKLFDIMYMIIEIYIVFQIKNEYCKASCKRIYVLFVLKILPIVIYLYTFIKIL